MVYVILMTLKLDNRCLGLPVVEADGAVGALRLVFVLFYLLPKGLLHVCDRVHEPRCFLFVFFPFLLLLVLIICHEQPAVEYTGLGASDYEIHANFRQLGMAPLKLDRSIFLDQLLMEVYD